MDAQRGGIVYAGDLKTKTLSALGGYYSGKSPLGDGRGDAQAWGRVKVLRVRARPSLARRRSVAGETALEPGWPEQFRGGSA